MRRRTLSGTRPDAAVDLDIEHMFCFEYLCGCMSLLLLVGNIYFQWLVPSCGANSVGNFFLQTV